MLLTNLQASQQKGLKFYVFWTILYMLPLNITFRIRKCRLYSVIIYSMFFLFRRINDSASRGSLLNEQVNIFYEPYNAPTYFDNHKKDIQ